MRRTAIALALALALAPVALADGLVDELASEDGADDAPLVRTGERVFALTMERNHFNGRTWPDTPLLEAYAGETMRFVVHVPAGAEMHTFHLHGHPWEDPDTGRTIDAVMLDPTQTHRFTQTAGLGEGHSGDWLYHCHVGSHFEEGMWGLLRVYPYQVGVEGPLDALDLRLEQDGEGLEDASVDAILRDEAGDPSADGALEGEPVPVDTVERGSGVYGVAPEIPDGADGELVLRTHHGEGTSLARLDLDGEGGYALNRHVGVDAGEAPIPELSGSLPGTPET